AVAGCTCRSRSRTGTGRRRPGARCRETGSPRSPAAPTIRIAGSRAWPGRSGEVRTPGVRWKSRSSGRSLSLLGVIADDGHEQVGDAGSADVAKRGELLAVGALEEENATAEDLALVDRLERPGVRDALGAHEDLDVPRLDFLHAAVEHDPPAVDEDEVGQDVL